MINGVDYAYYWNHQDEYKRLTEEDLKFEPTLQLMEFILEGLREEIDDIVNALKAKPHDKDNIAKAKNMVENLKLPYYEGLTYGNNMVLVNKILEVVPKEVRERWKSAEKCASGERKTTKHSKAYLSKRASA